MQRNCTIVTRSRTRGTRLAQPNCFRLARQRTAHRIIREQPMIAFAHLGFAPLRRDIACRIGAIEQAIVVEDVAMNHPGLLEARGNSSSFGRRMTFLSPDVIWGCSILIRLVEFSNRNMGPIKTLCKLLKTINWSGF